jgi:hypothetical protein
MQGICLGTRQNSDRTLFKHCGRDRSTLPSLEAVASGARDRCSRIGRTMGRALCIVNNDSIRYLLCPLSTVFRCLPIYPTPIKGLPLLGSWAAQHSTLRVRFRIGNSRAPLPNHDIIGPCCCTCAGVHKHYVNTPQNTKTQKRGR